MLTSQAPRHEPPKEEIQKEGHDPPHAESFIPDKCPTIRESACQDPWQHGSKLPYSFSDVRPERFALAINWVK